MASKVYTENTSYICDSLDSTKPDDTSASEQTLSNESHSSSEAYKLCGYIFGEHALHPIPVHYLSAFIKYSVPADYVNDQSLKSITQLQFEEQMLRHKFEVKQNRSDVFLMGSEAEGLSVPIHLDKDGQIISPDDKISVLSFSNIYEKTDGMLDDFNALSLSDTSPADSEGVIGVLPTEVAQKDHVHVNILDKFLQENQTCRDSTTDTKLHQIRLHSSISSLKGDEVSLQSIVLNMGDNESKTPYVAEDGDTSSIQSQMCGIHLKTWPDVADNWVTRHRISNWPSAELTKELASLGVHLFPVENTDQFKEAWRYSFFLTEISLAQSLTKGQRQCFILLKMICSKYLYHKQFTHQHLKTFFLWICEFIPVPDFHDSIIGNTFVTILESLKSVFSEQKLDHYFIDGVNLLEDMSKETCQELTQQANWICDNVLEAVLEVDTSSRFVSILHQREKLSVVFAAAAYTSKCTPLDERAFVASVHEGLTELLRSYIQIMKKANELPSHCAMERKITWNISIELLRELLVDIKEFEDTSCNIHNMDFMIGSLINAKKDPQLLALIFMHLCIRAGLEDLGKMKEILGGVKTRTGSFLKNKAYIVDAMQSELEKLEIPAAIDLSNKALYLTQFKDEFLANMLDLV